MELSIIIVSYNTKEKLRLCLQAAFGSRTKYDFEVWVVDNASADRSADMVQAEFRHAHLIKNEQNLGYARANNQVMRRLASRYVLLLNSDVVVAPDSFDKMISFMDNNPIVGIAGPRVVKPDGTLDLACRRKFPNPASSFFRFSGLSFVFPKSRISSYNLTYLSENEIAEVDSVMGAFLLIRRAVINRIGLLDESYFMYGEDLDWCFRAKATGFKVMYVPITTVVHDKGSSSRQDPHRALYEFHRAMQIFYDKHYRQRYNFFVNFLVKLGIWSRYILKVIINILQTEKYVSK